MDNKQISKGEALWNKILSAVMHLPGVKVDRTTFLLTTFKEHCDNETLLRIVKTSPGACVGQALIDRVARGCIKEQTRKVTTMSAAAGIPGGLALLGTVPADITQYYYHTLILAQKLAYLYGYPSLTDRSGQLTDEAKMQLTVFVGVMSGVSLANEVLNTIASNVAEHIAKKLPETALAKTALFPIVKKIAALITKKQISDKAISRGISKAIPFVSAAISGAITYYSFKPSALRFQEKLKETMPLLLAARNEQIERQ